VKNYIIAEIGINHNGSVEIAKNLILKAKKSGCDAVKFQKRDVDSVYSSEELDAPRESPWGTTNREQKNGLELTIDNYMDLCAYTKNLGMDFSTGMSTQEEVDEAMRILGNSAKYVLACTSTYPTRPEDINLLYIDTLASRYPETKVGFSNHYNGHDACVAAVARGAQCVEFHITLDRTMYGSDQSASIENADALVSAIREVEKMLGTGEKSVLPEEVSVQKKLRKVSDTV